jgi:hypothetical protein
VITGRRLGRFQTMRSTRWPIGIRLVLSRQRLLAERIAGGDVTESLFATGRSGCRRRLSLPHYSLGTTDRRVLALVETARRLSFMCARAPSASRCRGGGGECFVRGTFVASEPGSSFSARRAL